MELVKKFEKEYSREEKEEVRQQETEEKRKVFSKELPEGYTVKLLYDWRNKKYDRVLKMDRGELEMIEEKSVFKI